MRPTSFLWIAWAPIALALIGAGVWVWQKPTNRTTEIKRSGTEEVLSQSDEPGSVGEAPVSRFTEMEASASYDETPKDENKDLIESSTAGSPSSLKTADDPSEKTTSSGSDGALENTGTSQKQGDFPDAKKSLVAFGFTHPSAPRSVDTVILHSSYDALGNDPYSTKGIFAEWQAVEVSPHYFVDREGTVYQLVKEEDIAYHAGVSRVPDGRTNVNAFSIGIETANTKTDQYTDKQYVAVKKLIAFLKQKYTIKYVLGHDDIAPDRKTDPWNFDWKKLE